MQVRLRRHCLVSTCRSSAGQRFIGFAAFEQGISTQMARRAREHGPTMTRCTLACICLMLCMPARAAASLDLASFRGRVVYLDFWASWCGPCKQSFPWMETMKRTYAGQGLEVIAVDLDGDRADADRFLAQFHPTFDVRFDPEGELAEAYKVQGMPSSVL